MHAGLTNYIILKDFFKEQSFDIKIDEYENMMWTRDFHTTSCMAERMNRNVVIGHTCVNETIDIINNGNVILMDTGISTFDDGVLSAYNPYTEDGYQIPAKLFPMDKLI